ncbi:ORF1ab protein [NL63-related bat coronavirus]|uniref:ORF1ab polyprotein n=17 Tax=Alphacoronavirus TaxID=693996 RepID=A0A1L2KGC3_9ALPC|nr:ORF1ab protein [NL63-related bat coronavirus]APD51481.1 ORF1ab protein [NL63-related bat coronavirus]
MAYNQLTLAVASDSEISGHGCSSLSEAVHSYSVAASSGFGNCRFVSFGLQDLVNGVKDDDFVLCLTGDNVLRATIGPFGDRPCNLRGWLIFSNSNYTLQDFDVSFGGFGGNKIPVDQYMCGYDGKPVIPAGSWEFKNYFEDGNEITLNGVVYYLAWQVERKPLPHANQNLLSITEILYLSKEQHTLLPGSILTTAAPPKRSAKVVLSDDWKSLYEECGSPFVNNGTTLLEVVPKPVFLNAFVNCKCGNSCWSVGDWTGYKSACCGENAQRVCVVPGEVVAGDIVVTSKAAGVGVKYYTGMTLKFVKECGNVHLWRVIAVQSSDGFVASSTYDEDAHYRKLDPFCFDVNTQMAKDLRLAFLGNQPSDAVKNAVCSGVIDISAGYFGLYDDIINSHKPWFVRKLSGLVDVAWNKFVTALKNLPVTSAQLVKFLKAVGSAAIAVTNGVIRIVADVPSMFADAFELLKSAVSTIFDAASEVVTIGGQQFRAIGSYILLNNAIVKIVTEKVKGVREHSLRTAKYANAVIGCTVDVTPTHIEPAVVSLKLVDQAPPIDKKGRIKVIGGQAFYFCNGVYRLMATPTAVLQEPVFAGEASYNIKFKESPPSGFTQRVVTASTSADAVLEVESLVSHYRTPFLSFVVSVEKGEIAVKREYMLCTPFYMKPVADKWEAFCVRHCLEPWFADDYGVMCNAVGVDTCKPSHAKSQEFLGNLRPKCPTVLFQIDGGKIWDTVVNSCKALFDFVKSAQFTLTPDGLLGSCAKRFRQFMDLLLKLYNEFLGLTCKAVKTAGVTFKFYAVEQPYVVFNGVLSRLARKKPADVDCSFDSRVGEFWAFIDATYAIDNPKVADVEPLELSEVDFVPPTNGGRFVISDDFLWYNKDDLYYPAGLSGVLPKAFTKNAGGKITFSDEVVVHDIEPTHKVKLIYEFEDDKIADICKKTIGKRIVHTGDWDALCNTLRTALDVLSKHVKLPECFIYDEEGGNDYTKPVMISQWPAAASSDDESVEDVCEDPVDDSADVDESMKGEPQIQDPEPEIIIDEVQEVNDALNFIVPTESSYKPDPFAYPYNDFNGLKVLKQSHNNCWVNATCIQLQLTGLLSDEPAVQLFKAGRVAPLVKQCYEALSTIKGALGDVAECMDKLLKDSFTMFITCDTVCGCKVSRAEFAGSFFRFMPVATPFPYGGCSNCRKAIMHTIRSIKGTGVFSQAKPAPFDVKDSIVPVKCAAVYLGSTEAGHYKVNIFDKKVSVDGMGVTPINNNNVNTLCVVDVDYTSTAETPVLEVDMKPFAISGDVQFFQGEVGKVLTSVKHDFVVNAANEKLAHGGGIAKALNDFTGGELQVLSDRYIKKNGPVKVGAGAMIDCKAARVLNVVGPRAGKHEVSLLTKAYKTILRTPGFGLTPILSCGIFGVKLETSLNVLLDVITGKPLSVVVYSDSEVDAVKTVLASRKSAVSEEVVPPADKPAAEEIAPVSEPADVVDDVVVQKSGVDIQPFRVEGNFEFYNCNITDLTGPEPFVLFTSPTLKLDKHGEDLDKQLNGVLSSAISDYLSKNKAVPAGNMIKLVVENTTVYMSVVPNELDPAFSKNVERCAHKLNRLKLSFVTNLPPSYALRGLLSSLTVRIKFVTHTIEVVDECFKPSVVTVKVTEDGVNVKDVVVDTSQSYQSQIGVVSDGKDVLSGTLPSVQDEGQVLVVAPNVDWQTYYGFPEAEAFSTFDCKPYEFENDVVNGMRVMKTSDNNCWVNATCIALQYLKPSFKSEGLRALWNKFVLGDVGQFVRFVYHIAGANKGDKGDAEDTLFKLSKFIESDAVTVLEQYSACVECADTTVTVSGAVVCASVLRDGCDAGHCPHRCKVRARVKSVKGRAVVTNVEVPTVLPANRLLKGVAYVAFSGPVDSGHYTVFDARGKSMYDGDRYLAHDLSTLAVSSVVMTGGYTAHNVTQSVVVKPEPTVMERIDKGAGTFFKWGDFLMHNFVLFFTWLFTMCSLVVTTLRKKDIKIMAMAPERTGVVLRKSLKYNVRASITVVKQKWWLLSMFFKLLLLLYTVYAAVFMSVRFGPFNSHLCDGVVSGYEESSFDKDLYCGNSPMCKMCLFGYQELNDFEHTSVIWRHLTDPLFSSFKPVIVLGLMLIFGNMYLRFSLLYFVAQYFNKLGVFFGFQQTQWYLNVLPFDLVCDELIVSVIVYKALMFLRHVLLGCTDPNCVACSKSARLRRVPLQTIVNGTMRSFYVSANGGAKLCKKHNFFCVNCDEFGPGNTFINGEIARELGNVTKTSVQPTAPAYVIIDKVDFADGFYRLYAGETFWRYDFDITEPKYGCKEVLKNCNTLVDFIVFNNSGTNVTQVKNLCVYLSQLLCKPIKLVDSELLATLSVDFNGVLHKAYVEVLCNSFAKELNANMSMAECKAALGVTVSDEDFVNAVANAHRHDILLSEASFNNFVTSYAKPEEKLSAYDVACCMRAGAKVVNHNVLIKESLSIVWSARDFNTLSQEGRKYIVKTTKAKGLTFLLTFNDNAAITQVPATSIVSKQGAGFKKTYSFIWYTCLFIVALFSLISLWDFTTYVDSFPGYDFKYIENGQLKVFDKPLGCVRNVFNDFNQWHQAKFGSVPTNSDKCPIVVGVSERTNVVPGIPTNVYLVGKTLVFTVQAAFSDTGVCYDLYGPTTPERCIFNSACTKLEGLGGVGVYCHEANLVDGAKLYSDLQPNTYYRYDKDNYVRLPEILMRGFGFKTIRTLATTYCRVGECIDSMRGVCFGLDKWFVYDGSTDGHVCGDGLLDLLLNVLSIFSASFSVAAMSGQIVFNFCIAALVVFMCFLVTKFKRVFGDMSLGVCTVVCATVVNNLSYVVTQNVLFMIVYALLYFAVTRTFRYAWIWYIAYVIAYIFFAPWWLYLWFVIVAIMDLLPNLFKLKVSTHLFDGDKFVGTFENAAAGTFVLDMHSYEKLVNSIAPEKLKSYAASYNKYKYYSGGANEADYRCACYAHLAKAMMDYAQNHNDMLYSPPTISYNSTLQAGLRKMAQPSGRIESCVVRVCYGNTVLNGIWLGDTVYCPRHIIAPCTTSLIDYDHAYSIMRLHNFSISVGNVFLGVISAVMQGSVLRIKVSQNNINTPPHSFRTLKPGESFNILACYDGVASGVFGVNLRTNYTIRGSFINGACGSPGYNVKSDGTVEFVYLHQIELGSGCHVGSSFEGAVYGGFEDQPTLQVESASTLVTDNLLAFLYAALLNGCNWWLKGDVCTVDSYNEWAHANGFTAVNSVDCYSILAAKTGVSVERLLSAIQRLANGFGGKNILGYTSLCDEFTLSEVIKQMYGVSLQSGKTTSVFKTIALFALFFIMFWSELFLYTTSFWFNPVVITPVLGLLVLFSLILTGFVKHKMLFLQAFLLPVVMAMAIYNCAWDMHVNTLLATSFDYHVSFLQMDIQGLLNVVICLLVTFLHTWRFAKANFTSWATYVCSLLAVLYTYFYSGEVLSLLIMFLCAVTNEWYIGAMAYRLARLLITLLPVSLFDYLGETKVLLSVYLILGYLCCVYWGILYWVNRFFKCTMGIYDFKVSPAEFKYMVANGLSAPQGPFDAVVLSFKLLGIGGPRTIKISTVQSKLTDIKCTNVVLLGCLSNMNIAANSSEWAYCVNLHNKINLCNDPEQAQEMLLALLAFFLSKHSDFGVDELVDSYFENSSTLQSVASSFVNMPSYIAYENARQAYEDAVNNGSNPQLVKQLKRAMNIAKSEFDHELSVQKKIGRMAEQAAAQMYKEARAVNRKAKVISAMHAMLFGMLRRLDMSSVENVLSLARDGVVPLSIIPAASASRLTIVSPDFDSYVKIVFEGCVHYAGVVWNIVDVKDNDGKPVHIKEITKDNVEAIVWPIILNCERVVKLQNNEIMPGKLKQKVARAEGDNGLSAEGKALYNTESGKTFMYAFISSKADLKCVKWEHEGGCATVELDAPCRFMVETPNGPQVKYLYFVKNLNTLRRGAVLGFIGATIRLQAGKQTELAANSGLLTVCAFAVDPAAAYLDAVKQGAKPVGNCVKMLTNGAGNGQAVTATVDANSNQDSYGGASVCLYCRAHVPHNTMDGYCKYKGKYVQIPMGCMDPIRFCLENEVCKVCGCWLNNGCVCDRTTMQSFDHSYLNRARGSSAARLEPCNGTDVDVCVRAFDIYNKGVSFLGKCLKVNCARFKNADLKDGFFVIKRCPKSVMDHEQSMYELLKGCGSLASHDFFTWREGRSVYGNVSRQNLTKYTMMDLVFALRNFDEKDCEVLKEILVLTGCCDESYFDNKDWYDPVENEDIHRVYATLGKIVSNAMLKCVALCDEMVLRGVVGVLTLDNQDLNGNFYDFGDFIVSLPGMGVPCCTSYYSYMMPIMGLTNCLASECFIKSDIFGQDFKTFDLLEYDFTEHKERLFQKYFKYWGQDYHPNCSDCYDDMCVVHCANFNTLFATTIPNTAFGPLCRKVFIDGVPLVATAGYHFKQLGLVWNKDVNTHSTRLSINELLQFVTDPALIIASSPALVDQRTVCFSVAALSTGMTNQTVKPGHFNQEFYDFLRSQGFFEEGSELTLKHFFFAQKGDAAVRDFDYYRYNRPTMLDICQARVTYKVVQRYFDVYEGGCITARDVVVTNLNKSAGWPLNKFGKAGLYYESLSYEEQDALFALTKRNVLPTMTQLNLKYAISGKERARTVGGVSLLSTMTTRQYHQKHLKSIVNTRNASVVIGTTKFYGGWDNMLKNLIEGVENPRLMGWDYPKCDRALPNMIRMISAMILGSKHVTCCSSEDKFYRLSNELAQVLTEVVYSNGGFYLKPGGTTSGDATTAYANSVFNIFQAVSANINRLLGVPSDSCNNIGVKELQRRLYDNCYRSTNVDESFVDDFYGYLRKHFSMMILSDDGVVCYNKDYAELGYIADIGAFKATLYYQNNVFMSTSKCWVEDDLTKGPHEFCSQHTMQIVDKDGTYYLPYPDPSRILSAGVFVDDIVKTDAVVLLERYVSLAIDAYPLSKHSNPEYRKVFYVLLDWVRHLNKTLNAGILESFSVTLLDNQDDKFWNEEFYASMYEKSTVLQAAGLCVVCGSQTVLRCGDCLRRPMLCTKCAYDHVFGTDHRFILAITPYVCNASGCGVNDVTKLYLGGLNYYCVDHKPQLSFPLCSAGNIFGLYKNSATGSLDVEVFNKLATSDWTDVRDYKLANDAKDSLRLFAAETIKAKEESVKSSYAFATLKEIIGPKELLLSWESGKAKPPLNRNSVFTCFQISKDSKFQVGEFTFEKLDYGSDTVSYRTTATTKLVPGMIFVLTSHNVQPLRAPTIANQERYSTIYKLHPTFNISEAYANLVPYYQLIGRQRITTIQGPPGSGKSHCSIGLGLYYPGARIVFTACAHAAVDSLCAKAATAYSVDKCTRIIPARARVECYSGFKPNNTSAQYIFSTVNALPECNADIVVVDEVSMCTNYDLSVINQRLAYKHIVYVGDPQQLPAPRVMITKGVMEPADYNVVTQRMCAIGPDIFLHKCYRCPAEIVSTVSELVYENKFVPVKPDSKQCFKIFVKGNVQVDNGSSINRKQLDVVKQFLLKNPSWNKSVFISPYNSQNYVASRLLGLQIQTVDSSQGSEYDYVIYTQTSDTAHACNVNRFNVAITRAKKGIFCVMCDKELYDALKFFEIKPTDLQSEQTCGLFKDCARDPVDLPPAYAHTFLSLSDRFKTNNDLAVQIGANGTCTYEHVMSFMGFRFDVNVPGAHNLFCTRDFAIRNVRGWLGMDVEGAHVCGNNVGTNVPLQVGFSNGVDFVVQPEGCVSTNNCDVVKPVRARAPPGEQFTHLVPLLRKGQPWSVVRKRIVQMIADYLAGLSDNVVFVLWAGGLELTTMRYFVKIGPAKRCYCGKTATCYNSVTNDYCCFRHALGCDYIYNPYAFDIQQWGYVGSLSHNHHMFCNIHRNEHVASGDAVMTRCLAVYDCFVKNVDWAITYPFISNEKAINRSGRNVQAHVVRAALRLYNPSAVHDIGNPKGIRCAVTTAKWYCYDKQPVNSNVKTMEYDYMTHGQLEGLCLFWNCNVDMYPEFSIVCRFDTRTRSCLNLEGVNGGSLYVNNHAFHTPAYDKRAMAKLKPMPFFFYDESECDVVHEQVNYVPLRASNCVTRCNIGGAVCSKHANMYRAYVEAYNTFTQAGFTIWVPQSFDIYNLWQTFAETNLQSLENIAFNVVKKGSFVGAEGELPVAIVNDKVFVRDGTVDNLVFTNNTSLPTNVAFELYAKRKTGLTPPLSVLRNLDVVATYKFVLWDYEANRPFTSYTKDVCGYTDFAEDVCVCFDNSIQGSFERFTLTKNAVLFSNTAIKNLIPIRLNFGMLNGLPVGTTKDADGVVKPVSWFIYVRRNGQFQDHYDGYYTQGRTVSDFIPRSDMERDFLDMDMGVFITKYGLEEFGFEHVVYGDVSKTTLGGLHLLISQVRLSKMGILKAEDFVTASDMTLKCCTITYLNDPSSKSVCTYMDLLLDDFVSILKSLDLSVVSKVHEVVIDGKPYRWMLWCKDNQVATFYPQLQSAEWKCGYSMPTLYKVQRMCLEPCNLYNYGAGIRLPNGIMLNVVKYTQLCQYLNSTTMCVPHNMRVLHYGAGSDKGVAPGTAVLKRWLPHDAIVVDNDVNEYVSDADYSITGDCATVFLEDKFDLLISDMYDGKTKSCDGENVSKDGFFVYLNGVIQEKLSIGGTVAIKVTEYSWNKRLYELIQRFAFWTLFCTSVNTSSSEAFLIGVNYLGEFANGPFMDGNTIHANYIFWRNSTVMTMSYNSVLDLSKFECKHRATAVVNLKPSDVNDMVLGLVSGGKLLIRCGGKFVGFNNHLVSTK